ncbi:hypothetical protein PIB30_057892 [Stylosanthes scabra]|uniref:Uncharacterized protein n=1 Tax=Stylosanthes scabra TaxID=79078 RepID=A0ABU6VIC3_9FABA|nr:hypothetical protein [Stylosanthes scabra]
MADLKCVLGAIAVAMVGIVRSFADFYGAHLFRCTKNGRGEMILYGGVEIPPVCLLWSLFVFAPYLMWRIRIHGERWWSGKNTGVRLNLDPAPPPSTSTPTTTTTTTATPTPPPFVLTGGLFAGLPPMSSEIGGGSQVQQSPPVPETQTSSEPRTTTHVADAYVADEDTADTRPLLLWDGHD